jgi:DNA-binding NarL/FixJ family response regulator
MPTLSILLLGDATRSEFRSARAGLEQWDAVSEFWDVDSAVAALNEGRITPDIILIAQAFPGQFSPEAVDRLRRLAPLARVVGLLGSWCEGEMRSGTPWPAAMRVYWHQWPMRSRREFDRLIRGEPCGLALPMTASDEERVLADAERLPSPFGRGAGGEGRGERATSGLNRPHPNPLPRREGTDLGNQGTFTAGLVVIRSQSREMWAWLSAACRSRGFATILQRDANVVCVEGATAAIFDATDLGPAERDELRRMSAALQPAPVVALLSFPRIDQEQLALSSGAAAVLSKLVNVEDLLGALDVTGANRRQGFLA